MAGETQVVEVEVIAEPEVPVIAAVPEPEAPELSYTYQPTDEEGRNIGGRQVIKYRTQEELAQKLVEQNTLLIRKLRSETRKNRLGITDQEDIPQEAPRFSGPVEFKPRDLTDEERYQLSRDLMDPAKAIDAQKILFEASVGISPESLRTTLQNVQQSNMQIQAKQQADAFVAANPGYYKCQENFDAITSWMVRYDLEPVKDNFQRAYDTLLAHGVILQAPVVEVPQPEPVVVPAPEPAPPTPAPAPTPNPTSVPPRLPSGLSRDNSSSTGTPATPGSDIVYRVMIDNREHTFTGMAALKAMPADEYKRRLLHEVGFKTKVDKLDAQEANRRAGR